MKTRNVLYLANPYGFSQQQRQLLLPPLINTLENLGADVWEPFERNNQVNLADPTWAYQVAQSDYQDVRNCNGIFAVVNGTPPDEGVMVELGMAIALQKAVFLFRDDFRRCSDSEIYPLNLMLFAGFPQDTWQAHYYTSIEEIGNPQKALYQWLHA
jgi:nucleoside 2-deoxyribosyltransferase